jgi:hypothetical protein
VAKQLSLKSAPLNRSWKKLACARYESIRRLLSKTSLGRQEADHRGAAASCSAKRHYRRHLPKPLTFCRIIFRARSQSLAGYFLPTKICAPSTSWQLIHAHGNLRLLIEGVMQPLLRERRFCANSGFIRVSNVIEPIRFLCQSKAGC